MAAVNAWSIITKQKRQYAGNTGYADELTKAYPFDSHVAGCRKISQGDIVLIRDDTELLGVATIERIEQTAGTKLMRRCPNCGKSTIKERTAKQPRYRCNDCTSEFQKPLEDEVPVDKFVAYYGDSFRPAAGALSQAQLRAAAFRPSGQAAMEHVDIRKLEKPLLSSFPELSDFLGSQYQRRQIGDRMGAELADREAADEDEFVGSQGDQRDAVLRSIRQRRGQTAFRLSLIERYGARCQMTGCDILAVLEAAHIWPYRGKRDHHVDNGLLLRADIHTLFDLHLIAVRPGDLALQLAPKVLVAPEYAGLHNKLLDTKDDRRPSLKALEPRWKIFSALWPTGQ